MDLPLHPIVVHFPIALSIILPVLVFVFIWMQKKGSAGKSHFLLLLALAWFAAAGSAAATFTGEEDGEKVEKAIGEEPVEEHEEAGEMARNILIASAILMTVVFFMIEKKPGLIYLALLSTIVAAGMAARAGHSGGELVYEKNAASVHQPQK